jgi:hypothetical protein
MRGSIPQIEGGLQQIKPPPRGKNVHSFELNHISGRLKKG